jgi:hypothetical protein
MTSSDCLSNNNVHPRLSIKTHLNLPVSSIHNQNEQLKRTSSFTLTPTSTSPNNYFTPTGGIQQRFSQPNMFAYPRHPPPAPTLSRKHIQFKPPEQDILDKNFFQTFDMEEKVEKKSENTTNRGNNLLFTNKSIILQNSFNNE